MKVVDRGISCENDQETRFLYEHS